MEYFISYIDDDDKWAIQRKTMSLVAIDNNPASSTFTKSGVPEITFGDDITMGKLLSVSGTILTNKDPSDNTFDVATNKIKYDQFYEALDKLQYNNTISMKTTTKIAYFKNQNLHRLVTNHTEVKLQHSPFYLETNIHGSTSVIFEDKGRLFTYDIPNYKVKDKYWIDLEYLGDASENIEIPDFNYDDTTGLDYKKIPIVINDNEYTFSGYIKDILDDPSLNSTLDVFNYLGIDLEVLKDIPFEVKYFIDDNSLQIIIRIISNVEVENYDKVEVKITMSYNFSEISKIDIYDPTFYYVRKPNALEEVTTLTDVTQDIYSIEQARPHYYFIYLEGGQYYLELRINRVKVTFYTETLEEVDVGALYQNIYISDDIINTFVIPEGYYYIKVETFTSADGYHFKFNKLNYDTEVDFNNAQIISEGELNVEIEGKYDILYLNYISTRSGVIYVTGEDNLSVQVAYYDGNIMKTSIFKDEYFKISKGNNYFYMYGNPGTASYQITFIPN